MSQAKRKHQFQIRKVPLKRFVPEKTPQLYALDVHSICLPQQLKNKHNWVSLHHQLKYSQHQNTRNNYYQQDFNQQILSSKAYKQLYSVYLNMREQRQKQKNQLQSEIQVIDQKIEKTKVNQQRLCSIRDGFYTQIQNLRDRLTVQRDHNYNLRWQVYNQRGPHYANLYGYSFLQGNQLTYQQLLQMQQRIGSVNNGLSLQQIQKLQKRQYNPQQTQQQFQREICCICYDEINNQQWITILKCKHIHHCQCLKDWLVKQRVCPICKNQVNIEIDKQIKQNNNNNNNTEQKLQQIRNQQQQLQQHLQQQHIQQQLRQTNSMYQSNMTVNNTHNDQYHRNLTEQDQRQRQQHSYMSNQAKNCDDILKNIDGQCSNKSIR